MFVVFTLLNVGLIFYVVEVNSAFLAWDFGCKCIRHVVSYVSSFGVPFFVFAVRVFWKVVCHVGLFYCAGMCVHLFKFC